MSGSLQTTSVKDGFGNLLQISNSNNGVDSTLRPVRDGKGDASALSLSTNAAQVNGTLTITGDTSFPVTPLGVGAVARDIELKLSDYLDARDFISSSAFNNSSYNAHTELQAFFDACVAQARPGRLPIGTLYTNAPLVLKNGLHLVGAGKGLSVIRKQASSNSDIMATEGFDARTGLQQLVLRDFTLNGGYLVDENDPYAANTPVGNTSGYGLKICGWFWDIDIEVNNVPEVGAVFESPSGTKPRGRDVPTSLRFAGRIFGKEGLIFRGPSDGVVPVCFVGLAGFLPRPDAETTAATSTEFSGTPVAGVVVSGNLEWGEVHIYACWSGPGLRTISNARFRCAHLMVESNWLQASFEGGSYVAIGVMDVRNISARHVNWTGSLPTFSGASPDFTWGGVVVDCDYFSVANVALDRIENNVKRGIGAPMIALLSGNAIRISDGYFRAATATAGEPEEGLEMSGPAIWNQADSAVVALSCEGGRSTLGIIHDRGRFSAFDVALNNPIGYGVRSEGATSCNYDVTIEGQTQDSGVGAAVYDASQACKWQGTLNNCAQFFDFDAALPTNRTKADILLPVTRTFTIASDVASITPWDNDIPLIPESGTSDTVQTINGGRVGQEIDLRLNAAGDTITLGRAGNLRYGGPDLILVSIHDRVVLKWRGAQWVVVSAALESPRPTRNVTIAGDAITVTASDADTTIILASEGAAATDDLVTINGGYAGMRIGLRINTTSGLTVTVRETGNIRMQASTRVFSHLHDILVLESTGSQWVEVSYADNS